MQLAGLVSTYIIYFMIYSMVGYLCEVVYCSVGERKLVNRGFLYGPYLPIYGFGALAVIIALDPFLAWPPVVFLLGIVVTSALEYFVSWLLEKFFSIKLWDYSKRKFNLNGRICALNSLLFAFLVMGLMYFIHPLIISLVQRIPDDYIHLLALVVVIVISVDTTSSIMQMAAFRDRIEEWKTQIKEMENRFELLRASGATSHFLAQARDRMNTELEILTAEMREQGRHIISSFPSMTSRNQETEERFEKLRSALREWSLRKRRERKERKTQKARKGGKK